MIDHLSVDVSDLEKSRRCYDHALAPLGYKKLSDGPYRVIELSDDGLTATIRSTVRGGKDTFQRHIKDLQLYESKEAEEAEPEEDRERYEVERIVDEKSVKVKGETKRKYLVKWAGYSDEEMTWEDAGKMEEEVPEIIRAYLQSKVVRRSRSS